MSKHSLVASSLLVLSLVSQSSHALEKGYVLSGGVWKDPNISVCWENPSSSNSKERQWVQAAIERTWMRQSQVVFQGWKQCPNANYGNQLRIKIFDEGPHTLALGESIKYYRAGMSLNFTFANWSPVCGSSGGTFRRHCIESIAVHEFGHALGFAHEQNRPDTPTKTCRDQAQGSNGDVIVGAWDLNSVMNYCNPSYNGGGELSAVDIQTVQQFYKTPYRDQDFTFDAQFYLAVNDDLRAKFGNDYEAAWNHWKTQGIQEGRRASRAFDVKYYINKNPDVKAAYGNNYAGAMDHWIKWGLKDGRRGSKEVDVQYYLNRHADLKTAYGTNYRAALKHFDEIGLKEGRQASADFRVKTYFVNNVDLRQLYKYTNSFSTITYDYTLGFYHWVKIGQYLNAAPSVTL